jgi:signal transduction histidine kinase
MKMEAQRIRVLLMEDDEVDYMAFKRLLREEKLPYDHVRARSLAEARKALKARTFDVALLDYRLADGTAFDLFEEIPEHIPFVIVTGSGDEEVAVQAMKAGASDYLIKDAESRWVRTISVTVRNAIKARQAEEALKQAHAELEQRVYQRTEEFLKANQQLQQEIEQRKRAAELLIQSERLKAIAELAAGVAHNFNNILQVMLSSGEVALAALRSNDLPRATTNLQRIVEGCRSGAETVRRLQDFAALRSGPESQGSVVSLSQAVQKGLDMSETWWKSMPERQGFEVVLTKDLMPDCFVQGEENELLEVVINLVKNAVEAMPQGGGIVVKVFTEGKNALLTVEDSGLGIPEADLGRIFEPFFTTKGAQGTGMGLASAYGIVLRHGGQVSVARREGGGTRFSVSIPLVGEIREATPRVKTELPPSLRVLIIDDQEPIVAMMEQLFARRGHTVVTALSGQEALNIFEHYPVDVVISDLSMPSMTGWQVGKAIKDLCRNKEIPRPLFLILTGWGNRPEDTDRGVEAGIDAIIEKPVNFEKLMAKIQELYHQRERLAASHVGAGAGLY